MEGDRPRGRILSPIVSWVRRLLMPTEAFWLRQKHVGR